MSCKSFSNKTAAITTRPQSWFFQNQFQRKHPTKRLILISVFLLFSLSKIEEEKKHQIDHLNKAKEAPVSSLFFYLPQHNRLSASHFQRQGAVTTTYPLLLSNIESILVIFILVITRSLGARWDPTFRPPARTPTGFGPIGSA